MERAVALVVAYLAHSQSIHSNEGRGVLRDFDEKTNMLRYGMLVLVGDVPEQCTHIGRSHVYVDTSLDVLNFECVVHLKRWQEGRGGRKEGVARLGCCTGQRTTIVQR